MFKRLFKKKIVTQEEAINIVESISKAENLYKKLIIRTHPDHNIEKQALANELSKQVNEFRYSYKELMRLQEIIEKEL